MLERLITAGCSCLVGVLLGTQMPKMGRWLCGFVAHKKSHTQVILPKKGKQLDSAFKERIIDYLKQNPGRYSLQDLATALGVHFMRLMQSLNRLVENGIIKKKGESYELAK